MAALIHHPQPWSPPPDAHKRGHSASAISFRVSDLTKHQDKPDHDAASAAAAADIPPSPTSAGHSINLKPYLRKFSLRDNSNVVDLSRSYAENQSIAGLAFFDESRSASDLAFSPSGATRSLHKRSTSNNSNFSISSNPQRPTAPYAYPMRHTPRPYTPPIARSLTANSSGNSEASDEVDDIMSDEDFRSRQRAFDPSRRSGSIGSLPTAPQPYHSYSNSSLTRLNNISQSSLPTTSRSRGDTMRSIETVPSSRTSMERAIGFFNRTGSASVNASGKSSDEPVVDAAVARAATIQAARLAYAEREEAKERKAEKESLKAQDRAERKKRMKEERSRRRSGSGVRTPPLAITAATTAASGNAAVSDEKLGFVGRAYDDYEPAHSQSLPAHVPTATTAAGIASRSSTKAANSSTMKSRWLGFVAWFRTRVLRMKRKLKKNKK